MNSLKNLEDNYRKRLESILGVERISDEELYLVSNISSKFLEDLKIELNDVNQEKSKDALSIKDTIPFGMIRMFNNRETRVFTESGYKKQNIKSKKSFLKKLFSKNA